MLSLFELFGAFFRLFTLNTFFSTTPLLVLRTQLWKRPGFPPGEAQSTQAHQVWTLLPTRSLNLIL